MIGSGLKKFAQEHGMKAAKGVAYGCLCGFAATLSEGAGYKQIVLTTTFPDLQQKEQLMQTLNNVDLTKAYRIQKLSFSPKAIQIIFTDNPGTMNKIREFVNWFLPLLQQSGATGAQICTSCGSEVVSGRWVLINGIAYYMHDICAQKAAQEIEAENTKRKEEDTGSYLNGTLGALLGSMIGAVAWALVLNLGYVASLIGFLIGWLAEKGYNLLKGKQGKAKIAILIVAVILGVLLGNIGADVITLVGMISNGEMPGFGYGDIPNLIMVVFMTDGEYRSAVLGNVVMGLLFAGLGVFSLLRKAGREVADQKYIVLE